MWFGNSSAKRLRRMLEAIRSRDFTLRYAVDNLRGEERLLAEEINAVISEFRDTQMRQEALYGSYRTMLDQVNAALFADDCHGRIIWMNERAVRDLCGFRIPQLSLLSTLHPDLPALLEALQPGHSQLLRLRVGDRDVEWNATMTKYYREGEEARLFSIENVQSVLQQKEVEAQKRLVSVLTHEIMNSLAPIISLSETLMDITSGDARQALSAIHRRSEGLLKFVNNYRQLSRISPPQKEPVRIGDLIADIQSLFPSPRIAYRIEDPTEEILIDRHQMEQVLINLLKNAEEAAGEQGEVSLSTTINRSDRFFFFTVTDNGPGILPEVLDRIFTPFFTTKPGGSGIGLSLCRQIVIQHGGLIRVTSRPGHTEFVVQLAL